MLSFFWFSFDLLKRAQSYKSKFWRINVVGNAHNTTISRLLSAGFYSIEQRLIGLFILKGPADTVDM